MNSILAFTPWPIVLILLPLASALLCFLLPALRHVLGILTALILTVSVGALGWQIHLLGVYRHTMGGWDTPLGIELYADGLTLLMLTATTLVGLGVSVYARCYFKPSESIKFWPIWLFLVGGLNALFLSADIFNLYVTLELVGLAAVTLTALQGGIAALNGAMRYLLATLLGSLAYLLGVALLYHNYATVDIALLSSLVTSSPATSAAISLICVGLLLKTALFPFHFWLPPAHANASAPVSAALSALVIKAAFYILLRLHLTVFNNLMDEISHFFGLLGATAILWGSYQALKQERLKLLVAWSTIAQIGYLFLAFPLAITTGDMAWQAVAFLALSHALAKSAMFLSAGNLLRFGGHDRIADLDRVVQRLPLTTAAFALAGVSIIGLPPSGGFIGKWLLLEAALTQQRWDMVVVLILGGLLAAAYIFKVLGHTFTQASVPHEAVAVSHRMEWAALLLAFSAIVLGFSAPLVLPLLSIGNPFSTHEALP